MRILLLSIFLCGCTVDNTVAPCKAPEVLYEDTQACVGITAPMPEIKYISFNERGLGSVWGAHHVASDIIMINDDLERTCQVDGQVHRHEMIHYLLRQVDAVYESQSHDTPYFELCDAWGNEG